MSKAITGAAMLAGAVGVGAVMYLSGGTLVNPFTIHLMESLVVGGVSMEAAAAAQALTSNRGTAITSRQPASYRQIVRGMQRVGGVIIYRSTTGSTHFQYNYVIVIAGHPCWAISDLYLDGRRVYWQAGSAGQSTRNGYTFGGFSNADLYYGPNGVAYNFGDVGHGPLVYCEARYGDQVSGDVIQGLTNNDPRWAAGANGNPYVGGCTYVYLKIEYDPDQFAGEPEIRFTVLGKPVYDPRTGSTGFSANAALQIADHITDTQFGMGMTVNEAQLIAAANICDEQVALANGSTEARYALNWHYDTATSGGDALQQMLAACGGRARYIGGEWYIFPAAWAGPSFSFGPDVHTRAIRWNATRTFDDLCNRVQGTYTAPNYPYNVTGDLYDSNGYYEGQTQNNWNMAWQATSFPQFACDVNHGYASDQYLNEDSGVLGAWDSAATYDAGDVVTYNGAIWRSLLDANTGNAPAGGSADWELYSNVLVRDLSLPAVCSISQAQRLAKIELMRNRFQGSGQLSMHLTAYRMQSLDIMQHTFPFLGWTDKLLEVDQPVLRAAKDDHTGAVSLRCVFDVRETDQSIYEWSVAEEQTIYALPAARGLQYATVQPPTGLTLISGASTALLGADGNVVPRIHVEWTMPQDPLATFIEGVYRLSGAATWIKGFLVDVSSTDAYISPMVAGQQYDVRVRSRRANGSASVWEELDGFTAGLVLSIQTTDGLSPGSLSATASNGAASIICDSFTTLLGGKTVTYFPSGSVVLSGLTQQTRYWVYVVDQTISGGDLTPVATTSQSDYLNKLGYFVIGSVVTPYAATGVSSRYYPTQYVDTGATSSQNPGQAFDGDVSTYATLSASALNNSVSGDQNSSGGCTISGWPSVKPTTTATLSVVWSANGAGSVTVSAAEGTTGTAQALGSGNQAATTATWTLPAGTDIGTVTVTASATVPDSTGSLVRELMNIYEVYIDVA